MSRAATARQDAALARLSRAKQSPALSAALLGPEMISFFKHSVEKRQTKLTRIAAAWQQLVPPTLADHCSLESFSRGSLTVLVDSASHLYELKQLLLAGLQQQLFMVCSSSGLRKITLKPGRWYDGETSRERKLRFS